MLAADVGLASFGTAWLNGAGQFHFADAIETKPTPVAKRRGEATAAELADRARRIAEIWDWLMTQIGRFGVPAHIIAEAGRGLGAGNAAITSIATGSTIATMLAIRTATPITWVAPREWRRYYCPAPAADFGERKRAAGVPSDDELYRAIGAAARTKVDDFLAREKHAASLWPHAMDAVGLGRWAVARSREVRDALGLVDEGEI